MQKKADVFEQVEGPRGCRSLVHLLLVLGLMRVDAFKDAQSPGNHRDQEECVCECLVFSNDVMPCSMVGLGVVMYMLELISLMIVK